MDILVPKLYWLCWLFDKKNYDKKSVIQGYWEGRGGKTANINLRQFFSSPKPPKLKSANNSRFTVNSEIDDCVCIINIRLIQEPSCGCFESDSDPGFR